MRMTHISFALLFTLSACVGEPKSTSTATGDDDDTSVGDDDDTTVGDDDDTVGDDDDDTTPGDDDDDTTPGDDDDDTTPGDDDDDDTTPGDDDDDDDTTSSDADGDGYTTDDCDDADPDIHPGAVERCNGLDDDCDNIVLASEVDSDGDGIYDCEACDEAGMWTTTRDLTGTALSAEVTVLVAANTCADYSDEREFLFAELDNDGGTITCVYTGKSRGGVGAGFNDWEDMNTEHTWPRSQGAEPEPMECDLHHLFITDSVTNSQRGSHPFGVVVNETTSILNVSGGEAKLGTDSSGDTVFEPPDEHKGNVARAMTYFAHRYGYTLSSDELSLYQSWHASDPVDDAELERTWAVADRQGAPNAFVVCPNLLPAL